VNAIHPERLDHIRLAAARLCAAEAQPFLAMALYALTPVADESRPTFAVDERWRLYVNPRRLSEWPIAEVAGVLLHEVGHVVRDHAGRARTISATDEESAHRWNLAADAEINDDLLAAGISLPPDPVTPGLLSMPDGKVAEFYYAALAEASAPPPDIPDCGPGCHGRRDGDDPPYPSYLPAGLSEAEALLLRRRIGEEIARQARNQPGTVPGGWLRWAEATMRPRLDWRKLLAAKVRSSAAAVAGAADYSYTRPPRRRVPHVVLPSLRRPLPRVAVIVDTSGSVDDDLLALAWTEVHGCLRSLGIRRDLLTLYAADTEVHRLTGPPRRHVALRGGGGTDMADAITAVLATRPTPDLIVVITDGYTPWPARPPRRDVIVALLPTADLPDDVPTWAHVVRVEPGQHEVTQALSGNQGGVEEDGGGGAGGGGRAGLAVQAGGLAAAVVEQVQLAGQDGRLGRAGPRGQVGQQVAHPAAVGLGGLLGWVTGPGFGAGPGERAAAVARLGVQLPLALEHGQQALARGAVAVHRRHDALGDAVVAGLKVGADQFVLAAERVVQRGLGHPGLLDDAVDADRVDALVVEQLVGRG